MVSFRCFLPVFSASCVARIVIIVALMCLIPGCALNYDQAMVAYERGDYPTAIKSFQKLASRGNVASMLALGQIYETGKGVPVNTQQTLYWYGKAAALGNADAETHLGELNLETYQDFILARAWFEKAAEQGDGTADANLWYIYHYGLGVLPDPAKAAGYYTRAEKTHDGGLKVFFLKIRRDIEVHKYYPPSAIRVHAEGKALVSFDYTGHLRATNIAIVRSSGNADLDTAAEFAVEEALLPPFPPGLKGSVHLQIILSFNLTDIGRGMYPVH